MELIQEWKALQRMGNHEFERQQWQSASQCYLHSILLLREHVSEILHTHPQDSGEVIICLSIAVQNLSDSYHRQNRASYSISLLNRALRDFQQLQKALPSQHPAAVALLRESCRLRQRIMLHKAVEGPPAPITRIATADYREQTAPSRLH